MKATCKAPSNIAFIKYWGKKNEKLRIPENSSVSMNLSDIYTITTVEFSKKYRKDTFKLKNEKADDQEMQRVFEHLDYIRKKAEINYKAKVISKNNFPKSTGLSSSASGLAALTAAGCRAAGLSLSEKELSAIARLGSGSACRSIPSGFVQWQAGNSHKTSFAFTIYPPDYWQVYDVVVIASQKKKEISSTKGHSLAKSSPFLKPRINGMDEKIRLMKSLLKKKNFTAFGELTEQEALNMHAVMITSWPPLLYWTPNTIKIMKFVQKWRQEGLESYFTINTGQDVHILVLPQDLKRLKNKLNSLNFVKKIIINKPAGGASIINKHLF